jgi:hypothetical protein
MIIRMALTRHTTRIKLDNMDQILFMDDFD